MKVSKGQSQPEIVAAAFLILYMVLGSPFLYRSVLIVTRLGATGTSFPPKKSEVKRNAKWPGPDHYKKEGKPEPESRSNLEVEMAFAQKLGLILRADLGPKRRFWLSLRFLL